MHRGLTTFILVVQSNRSKALQILNDLKRALPGSKLRHAMDLSEAYNLSEHTHPDVVILDEEHANASGLEMFLSLLEALSIDWKMVYGRHPAHKVPLKRQVDVLKIAQAFLTDAARRTLSKHSTKTPLSTVMASHKTPNDRASTTAQHWKTVLIGASTGGIEALISVLSGYPVDAPPTLIVQHINPDFLPGLADRLNRHCAATVRPARPYDRLRNGLVLIAPGDAEHLILSKDGKSCKFEHAPPINGHRPSVDALFFSAANANGPDSVGVILSGMGRDGASGLHEIRKQGGWTIGQDSATCTVFGMPRAAQDCGAVIEQLPIGSISTAVLKAAARKQQSANNA